VKGIHKDVESTTVSVTHAMVRSLVAQPAPGFDNYSIVIGPDGRSIDALVQAGGRLPSQQGESASELLASLPHSEPVAGDGEFVIDETDVQLPGLGIPFEFSRHYRSGVDLQTPIGYGWNHTFNERIVIADDSYRTAAVSSPTSLPDLF
jgi:hypothetical protein